MLNLPTQASPSFIVPVHDDCLYLPPRNPGWSIWDKLPFWGGLNKFDQICVDVEYAPSHPVVEGSLLDKAL